MDKLIKGLDAEFADLHHAGVGVHANLLGIGDKPKADLPPPGQFDIDLGKQLRVEQRAVLDPVTAIDAEPYAQGVEAVLGARMPCPREGQRVDHPAG